jgi:tetratricopeptide (TPR) repeat protein
MARVYTQLLYLTDQPPGQEATEQSAVFFQKALRWYRTCIDTAQDLGAAGMQGRSFLELGDIYLAADNPETALDAYQKCIALFEQCDARVYLHHAREKLEKLDVKDRV